MNHKNIINSLNFKNKNILILGGSKGIGLNISKQLTELDANCIILSRTRPKNSNNIDFYKCDINDQKIAKNIYKKITKKYSKLFAIINCASITLPSKNRLQNINAFKKTLDTNLIAYYSFLLNFYKIIEKEGAILNISSIYGSLSFPDNPSYAVSKSGINGLTRSLASDLSANKIRVNSISAGYIKSNMTKSSYKNIR